MHVLSILKLFIFLFGFTYIDIRNIYVFACCLRLFAPVQWHRCHRVDGFRCFILSS